MADKSDAYGWDEEDAYWTANYRNRPCTPRRTRRTTATTGLHTGMAMKQRAATRGGSGRTSVGPFSIVEGLRASRDVYVGTDEGGGTRCLGPRHWQAHCLEVRALHLLVENEGGVSWRTRPSSLFGACRLYPIAICGRDASG